MPTPAPLVTIALLTYNRVEQLKTAMAAILAQHYPAIEIFISDNHSTDGTKAYCQQLALEHTHVYYQRHPKNLGGSANFSSVTQLGQGKYYLWLADDDWIEPDYVAKCVAFLEQHPEYSWVAGHACYATTGQATQFGPTQPIQHTLPSKRVRHYYTSPHVNDNAIFYGMTRRTVITQLRLRNRVFGDLFVSAQAAFHGNMMVLTSTCIHRQHGISRNLESLCHALKISHWWGRHPTFALGFGIAQDILGRTPTYQSLHYLQRLILTAHCLAPVIAYGWRTSILYATWRRLRQYGRGFWRRLSLHTKRP